MYLIEREDRTNTTNKFNMNNVINFFVFVFLVNFKDFIKKGFFLHSNKTPASPKRSVNGVLHSSNLLSLPYI